MPELPEVNTCQLYFNRTALRQRIEHVAVHDEKIIRNVSGETFAERLKNQTFTGSYRQGKYLFGELDNGHSVLLHLGMTGDIHYYSEAEDRPKHERFAVHFDNGFKLGFDDPRKFAKIRYLEDRDAYLQEIGLGEDALRISVDSFLAQTEGKKSTIKGFLLNQSYLAGVGNLYADEICYQTRIHPASRVHKLSEAQLRDVHQKMREILTFAVEHEAHYKQYPDNWLWQWREEGKSAPEGDGAVKKMKIAGRTTYFCEEWQRLY